MLREDDTSRWIRGAVAAVYLGIAVANLLTLTGPARVVMTVLDLVTAVLMAGAALRRSRGEALALLPVAVSVAQVGVTGQLYYSVTVMLSFLVIGAAIVSRRIAVSAVLLGGVAWAVMVAAMERLHVPELGYYAVQMAFSALLGGLLHEAVRRRRRELTAVAERSRDADRLLAAVGTAAKRIRGGEDARSTITDAIRELATADTVTLLEPVDGGELAVTRAVGVELVGTRVPLDSPSMTAMAYHSGQPFFVADMERDPRVSPALWNLVRSRSMLFQPVVLNGAVVAVLGVGWAQRIDAMCDHRTRAVDLLADETALALEHERLVRGLERMAFTDTLTGLPNRRSWQESMDRLTADARATGEPLSVAIVDLDHFKRYNDTYGHSAGPAAVPCRCRVRGCAAGGRRHRALGW